MDRKRALARERSKRYQSGNLEAKTDLNKVLEYLWMNAFEHWLAIQPLIHTYAGRTTRTQPPQQQTQQPAQPTTTTTTATGESRTITPAKPRRN